jgi:hypothetical protein
MVNSKGCKRKWSWPYIEARSQHLRGRTEGIVHDTEIYYALLVKPESLVKSMRLLKKGSPQHSPRNRWQNSWSGRKSSVLKGLYALQMVRVQQIFMQNPAYSHARQMFCCLYSTNCCTGILFYASAYVLFHIHSSSTFHHPRCAAEERAVPVCLLPLKMLP